MPGLYLIATFPARHYDIEKYPAVKDYLQSFAKGKLIENGYEWVAKDHLSEYCHKKLEQSGEYIKIDGKFILDEKGKKDKSRKKTCNKWFETQDSISYWEDFMKPKIIFQEIVQQSQFFLDEKENFFCNDTCRIIVGSNLFHILGIMNSDLFLYSIRHFYGGGLLGESGVRMKHTFFEKFPCLPVDEEISHIAKDLSNHYDQEMLAKINTIIEQKYGLSNDEIALIHGESK